MASQWHLYSHIMKARLLLHTAFYRKGAELLGLESYASIASRPELFFTKFRALAESEESLRHLVFGSEHFSFLDRVTEPFFCPTEWTELYGKEHAGSNLIMKKVQSRYLLWKISCFLQAYLANVSFYFFDPKARGGNLPGIILKEAIELQDRTVPVLWSASPTPFAKRFVAIEAKKLLDHWKKKNSSSLWVYCNLQSLCHRRERERSVRLLSFAQEYPHHMHVLQVTVDSPLYLEWPHRLSLQEQCAAVVQELSKQNSLYSTSLSDTDHANWTLHAIDTAECVKRYVKTKNIAHASQVFMELFSLCLARRFLGFSIAMHPEKKEVFLTQACRECIDRGATFIFEQAAALSDLSIRELQALLWGRALLARGRLPYKIRMKGCASLFQAFDRAQVGVWLEDQLEKGLQTKLKRPSRLERYVG